MAWLQNRHASEETLQLQCTNDGRVTCLAYWYEIDLGMGHGISSGPQGGVTMRGVKVESSSPPHWRQAVALLQDNGVEVRAGQTLGVTASCVGSSMRFALAQVKP